MPAANRRDSDYPVGGLQRPGVSGRLDAYRTMETLSLAAKLPAHRIAKQPLGLAVVLAVGLAVAAPTGSAFADQAEEDAALAERLFEQRRRAQEIYDWARERAVEAVRNSPTGVMQRADARQRREECMAGRDPESALALRLCNDVERGFAKPDEGVVRELTERFVREWLDREAEEAEQELLDYLKRLLLDAKNASDSGQAV